VQPAELLDQATGLRRLLGEQELFYSVGIFGPDPELNAAATASLACALARRGNPACVIDELPGPRNVAGHLGLGSERGFREVARDGLALTDVLMTSPAGVQVLAASDGVGLAAAMAEAAWRRLGEELRAIASEWLLLTAAPGDQASLALACPLRLLVLPAEKKRLPEAYAELKAAHQRQPDGRWRVLVMNVGNAEQARQRLAALNDTARRFLGIEVALAGFVPKDEKIDMAVRSMRPLLEWSPAAPAAQAFRSLAEAMPTWAAGPAMGLDLFWQRLGLFSRMAAEPGQGTNSQIRYGRVYG
jgi:flagellar biosynthesis protein FlhG